MKNKFDMEYIDERIESMLVAKIAHYRLDIRKLMSNRHSVNYPDLHYTSIKGSIRNLRVWNKMAKLIDDNTIYMATKLTKL